MVWFKTGTCHDERPQYDCSAALQGSTDPVRQFAGVDWLFNQTKRPLCRGPLEQPFRNEGTHENSLWLNTVLLEAGQ